MAKTPFVWLGSGRAARSGVAQEGVLLDKAARAGLPVPQGAILLDELFRLYLREGVIAIAEEQVIVPDPVWQLAVLYDDVRLPRMQTAVTVRPIAPQGWEPESATTWSLPVDAQDARGVAEALQAAWSILPSDSEMRRDVLWMTAVAAVSSGRAVLTPQGRERIEVIEGAEAGRELAWESLGRWQRPSADLPHYMQRLQKLLRGLRRTLGSEEARRVEWVDDGEICWIDGIR